LKASKYCILEGVFFWKDPGGVLLNCLVENEAKDVMRDFYKGDCGGHHFWNTIVKKILRDGFYWPTPFFYVYKTMMSCHECHIFEGKRNFGHYPCNPFQSQLLSNNGVLILLVRSILHHEHNTNGS